MNCFECDGHNYQCESYLNLNDVKKCIYREIADNDLEKLSVGDDCITLIDMLEEYMEKGR